MKKYQTIDVDALRGQLASDERPVLVNALAREAFDDERIPGSISIPAADAMRLAGDVLAKDQPVVVGMEAWERAGHPIQRSRVPVGA